MLTGHLFIFFREMFIETSCLFLTGLFITGFRESFICSRYKFLIRYTVSKYFLPFCVVFTFLTVSFDAQNFILFHFTSFYLAALCSMQDPSSSTSLNPCPVNCKHRVLTTGPPGKSLINRILNFNNIQFIYFSLCYLCFWCHR